jgi:hypothetical protein
LVELQTKGIIGLSVFNHQITLVMELLIAVEKTINKKMGIQTAKHQN